MSSPKVWLAHGAACAVLFGSTVAYAQLDSDQDGVDDFADQHPCDPALVADSYAPAEGSYGMVLFEDFWNLGLDNDYNDNVVAYRYHLLHGPGGGVRKIAGSFVVVGSSGELDHALALHLPVPSSAIQAVTRSVNGGAAESISPWSTEAEVTVTLTADLVHELFEGAVGPFAPSGQVGKVDFEVTFTAEQSVSASAAPFDLFTFRTQDVGHEIHRSAYCGTSRMNAALFGAGIDSSNPAAGRCYTDQYALPSALVLPELAAYPQEGADIANLYPRILSWAASGGATDADWYLFPDLAQPSDGVGAVPSGCGLVAAYPMDGDLGDVSGNNNHLIGNASFVAGQHGSAAQLSGGRLSVGTLSGFTGGDASVTVSAWVRVDSMTGYFQGVVGLGNTSNYQHFYLRANNLAGWGFAECNQPSRSLGLGADSSGDMWHCGPSSTFDVGTWYHAAATYDAPTRTVRVYMNGQLTKQSVLTGPLNIGRELQLGGDLYNDNPLTGALDDVAVYSCALSAGEVQSLSSRALGGLAAPVDAPADKTCTDVVAYYPMDGRSQDDSGNGNHGSNTVAYEAGVKGQGARFGGTAASRLSLSAAQGWPGGNHSVTVAAWVKPDDLNGVGQGLVSVGNTGIGRHFYLRGDTDSWGFSQCSSAPNMLGVGADDGADMWHCTQGAQLTPGAWSHVAATYDAATRTVRVFLDGQVVKETVMSNPLNLGTELQVGGDLHNDNYFRGVMDEVVVYKRALTAGEVLAMYGNYGTSCESLRAQGATTSGYYSVDADGPGAGPVRNVYCDMTSDGGGWTLIGRGNWWGGVDDNLAANTLMSAAALSDIVGGSGHLFRLGSGASRLFIHDPTAQIDPGYHYWRSSDLTDLSCATAYDPAFPAAMTPVPVGTVSCDPAGVGQHNCGYTNGWILWHVSDTYDYSGGHPCAFGGGGAPTGASLTDLWVR